VHAPSQQPTTSDDGTYSRHRYQVPAAVHLHNNHRAPTRVGDASKAEGHEHHGIEHWGTSNNKEHTFLLPNHEWMIGCNGYSGTSHPTMGLSSTTTIGPPGVAATATARAIECKCNEENMTTTREKAAGTPRHGRHVFFGKILALGTPSRE